MVPLHVTDGDYSIPEQVRDWEFEYPFFNEGDDQSYVARRLMRCLSPDYSNSKSMERRSFPNRGYAYLVDIGKANNVDGQSQILEWEETWASIPKTRLTFQTTSYTEQYLKVEGGPIYTVIESTKSTTGEVFWEYGLGPFEQLLAPRLVEVGGVIYPQGGWRALQPGSLALAEDSDNGLYMGRIYYRKTIRVRIAGFSEIIS